MEPLVSSGIDLSAGEKRELPQLSMAIAATTTEVQVVVTQTELAQEQVKAAEHQRVWVPCRVRQQLYSGVSTSHANRSSTWPSLHLIRSDLLQLGRRCAEQAADTFPVMDRARKATPSDTAPLMLTTCLEG